MEVQTLKESLLKLYENAMKSPEEYGGVFLMASSAASTMVCLGVFDPEVGDFVSQLEDTYLCRS